MAVVLLVPELSLAASTSTRECLGTEEYARATGGGVGRQPHIPAANGLEWSKSTGGGCGGVSPAPAAPAQGSNTQSLRPSLRPSLPEDHISWGCSASTHARTTQPCPRSLLPPSLPWFWFMCRTQESLGLPKQSERVMRENGPPGPFYQLRNTWRRLSFFPRLTRLEHPARKSADAARRTSHYVI